MKRNLNLGCGLWALLLIGFSSGFSVNPQNCYDFLNQPFTAIEIGNGGYQMHFRNQAGRLINQFKASEKYFVTIKNQMFNVPFDNIVLSTVFNLNKSAGRLINNDEIVGDVNCPGMVFGNVETRRSQVVFEWEAPEYPEMCVNFQAFVYVKPGSIYYKSSSLNRTVCPEMMYEKTESVEGTENKLTREKLEPVRRDCCACGTASYKVTFSGLWNNVSHSKDFPTSNSHLHWTKPVGVSHTTDYSIYKIGELASSEVVTKCTTGSTTSLESGFWTNPAVKSIYEGRNLNGFAEVYNSSTSGFMSVNRSYPLFSMLSMMGPSPDWCTGVSSLNLCSETGCAWKRELVVPLYPWDAGVKSGSTYSPKEVFELPNQQPIQPIDEMWMPGNPFTPRKPVAQIKLERIDPVEDWQCSKESMSDVKEVHERQNDYGQKTDLLKRRQKTSNVLDQDAALKQMSKFLCATSIWSDWSACSAECGVGVRQRTRKLTKNQKNELCRHLPLREIKRCEGQSSTCETTGSYCELSVWSEWSKCNASCTATGYSSRMRQYRNINVSREDCGGVLHQDRECRLPITDPKCNRIDQCADKVPLTDGRRCGKPRARFYYHAGNHQCVAFRHMGCAVSLNNFPSRQKCETTCFEAVAALPKWRRDRMRLLQGLNSNSVAEDKKVANSELPAKCSMTLSYGETCLSRSNIPEQTMWYYSSRMQRCQPFQYSGCGGNKNKFSSYTACIEDCMPNKVTGKDKVVDDSVNCKVSTWSGWGPCGVAPTKCGAKGHKYRWRSILQPSLNGGKPCPSLYEKQSCSANC